LGDFRVGQAGREAGGRSALRRRCRLQRRPVLPHEV